MARWRIKLWTSVHHGAPPISRYTRVLRAAHGRVKIRFIRGSEHYNCTWTVAHITLFCFACFVLIGIQLIIPFQRQTGEPESLHTDKMSGKILGPVDYRNLHYFCPSLPLPSKWLNILCIKMLFFSLVSWWLHLSVFKFNFEACFACSAQYFLGQLLRRFSVPLRVLSRSVRPNEVKTVCFTYLLHSILVSAG